MTSKRKFDVVLGAGPHKNINGERVLIKHIDRHLHLIDSPGYYTEVILKDIIDQNPKLITARHTRLEHIATVQTTRKNYYLWKK